MIKVDMIDAIKVQFMKPIFEDDFPERGMIAWLTSVEYDDEIGAYKLFFDFSEFESLNLKYFKEVYYSNHFTNLLKLNKKMFTAIEAQQYKSKYDVYFSITGDARNDDTFEKEIKDYLREV